MASLQWSSTLAAKINYAYSYRNFTVGPRIPGPPPAVLYVAVGAGGFRDDCGCDSWVFESVTRYCHETAWRRVHPADYDDHHDHHLLHRRLRHRRNAGHEESRAGG